MLRNIISSALSVCCFVELPAAPVDLVLAPGGGFDVTYSLSTGQTTTGRDDLSGNIVADVKLDDSDQVARFIMTGGRLAHESETLDLTIGPTFFGTARVLFMTEGVATRPMTEGHEDPFSSVGYVDSFTGTVFNEGHRMVSNEGTATTRYLIGGKQVSEEVRNLAVNPDNTPLSGTTIVTATELQSGGWWKRMRIDLAHERDVTRTFPVASNPLVPAGTTYWVREEGSFAASGEGVFPGDDFITWAETHRGVTPTGFADKDPATGQPLLVMYALGAGHAGWSLPLVMEPDQSRAVLLLPSATRAPVKWEFSQNLSPESWSPLPEGLIPQGSTGNPILSFPVAGKIFLRAHVPVP